MILMTGYELPMRAIREQIASAVDVIVHTARLRDGSRKIVSITEVYGVEDDDILTQEIFKFEQTGVRDGKMEGDLVPTGVRPTFMPTFTIRGIELPPGEYGIPPEDPDAPSREGKSRWGFGGLSGVANKTPITVGRGRAVTAGGMVYISSVGPVDPETGQVGASDIKTQARQCLENLKAKLEEAGSSLEDVVWANWSLREGSEFDAFYEEWLRLFPTEAPVGQGTLMPLSHRRAGFRVSVGVIAAAGVASQSAPRLAAAIPVERPTLSNAAELQLDEPDEADATPAPAEPGAAEDEAATADMEVSELADAVRAIGVEAGVESKPSSS
jgi:enamine deaminase RidA (YjgF/YER057c/UK114 family)